MGFVRRPISIFAAAEGFGFGPASKLVAIVRAMEAAPIRWTFASEGPGAMPLSLS